jgi:hypothetical protein
MSFILASSHMTFGPRQENKRPTSPTSKRETEGRGIGEKLVLLLLVFNGYGLSKAASSAVSAVELGSVRSAAVFGMSFSICVGRTRKVECRRF